MGLGLLDKLFTSKDGKGIATQVIDGVGSIIDKYHVSPEDKIKIQEEADKVMKDHMDFVASILAQDTADTDSARKMNTSIQGDKPSWMAKNISYIIAIVILLTWTAFTIYLVLSMIGYVGAPKVDYSNLLSLYGMVLGVATTIVGFYFGSSHSSAEKQKTIDRLTQV